MCVQNRKTRERWKKPRPSRVESRGRARSARRDAGVERADGFGWFYVDAFVPVGRSSRTGGVPCAVDWSASRTDGRTDGRTTTTDGKNRGVIHPPIRYHSSNQSSQSINRRSDRHRVDGRTEGRARGDDEDRTEPNAELRFLASRLRGRTEIVDGRPIEEATNERG